MQSDGTSMTLGCAVGWGELSLESYSPHWCCSEQKVSQTAKEREAVVTRCPRGRQQLCPSPSAATPPVFPTGCPGFTSPHHSPSLLQAHPTEPQLPEPGRARDTQAMLWDGHQELPPTAPQHNKTKSYLSAPSLTAELDWSPGTLVSASA